MKFINDNALRDMNVLLWQAFGKGTAGKILELEKRIDELALKIDPPKRAPGRPRKVVNG